MYLKVILCASVFWIKLNVGFLQILCGKFWFYKRQGICSLSERLSVFLTKCCYGTRV